THIPSVITGGREQKRARAIFPPSSQDRYAVAAGHQFLEHRGIMKERTRLTTANVRTLLPDIGKDGQVKDEQIIFDDDIPGFGLRIRGESRTLVFQYKLGEKHRRKNLGPVNAVNFAETRKTAEKWYARVKLGKDPAAEVAEAKAKAVETFRA